MSKKDEFYRAIWGRRFMDLSESDVKRLVKYLRKKKPSLGGYKELLLQRLRELEKDPSPLTKKDSKNEVQIIMAILKNSFPEKKK